MAKVVVTGGAGFIGSHLVGRLVELEHDVTVVDNFSTGKRDNLAKIIEKVKIVEFDLANWTKLPELVEKLQKVEFIFHLAALPRIGRSLDNPLETHEANVTSTLTALEFARKLEVSKFLYASSSSVYGIQETLPLKENLIPNPQNPYAVQKLMGELYCKNHSAVFGLKTLAFRFFNVYGQGMSLEGTYKLVFAVWKEQIENGLPLTIYGDGEQTRDFTHVADIVDGLVLAMDYKQKEDFELFNLGAGRQVSVNYLASLFEHKVTHLPERPNEEKYKEADITRARTCLAWEPRVTIEEGVSLFKNENHFTLKK
ncbi:MAG: UDP-glucose 4-epimerase [Microgenomates group bacterium Gr01-1014_5]|nr:MAG: UDP-glucose 4-epimerase [Microgenomates group bacterium Gr01-1014_5]